MAGTSAAENSITSEAQFTRAEYDEIRSIIRETTGISMGEGKELLIYRRLQNRLKVRNLSGIGEYIAYLKTGDKEELELFTNAVTTNLTSFFRESHHFEFLSNVVIPELVEAKSKSNRRLRIWSAGCSTGEEPYSIAMTLRESFTDIQRWDAKLLCTDIDSNVLDTCRKGIYPEQRVEKVSKSRVGKWFLRKEVDGQTFVQAKPALKELIAFKQLNLMGPWPMKGLFDVIFCRNVIIYFDKATQRVLINRFADALENGGYLILGHSESLTNVSDRFELLQKTIYRIER